MEIIALMETLQAVTQEKIDDAPNTIEEKEDLRATTINGNEKAEFDETNAPNSKHKTDKKYKFSEEMLKAVDSDGRDITSWSEYLDKAKLSYDKRMGKPQLPLIKKEDLVFCKTLSVGGLRKVILMKRIDKEIYYAAKLATKAILVKGQLVQRARDEKLILQSIRFVFTIHLEFFFQDNVYLFYVMPFIPGGDMFTYLTTVKRLKEEQVRFYSAQMLLALEYLHYIGLIFRDLNPENILIDSTGYLKLADFGFCKAIDLRTYTFCGKAEYLAPEMLSCKGYGKSIDWWTFGVLLYELGAGYTPFYSKLQANIYYNISRCRYEMPYHFSSDLKDLIRNILQMDLTKRYGNLKNGVDDIKEHKFFNNIPWAMLLNREIQPPYMPVITGQGDTRNFERFIEKPLETTLVDLYYKEFANF